MDLEDNTSAGQSAFSREKTTPFLIRTFVKIGSFHRLTLFEDGTLPTTDEQQIFTWKDATLREVLTTLRNTAPQVAEYKHPLARFSFRTVYVDPSNKGRFSQKDIGLVYSRDILGEPGSLTNTAPRLLQDAEPTHREAGDREREERTLEELRFIPGDYLIVAVLLPKNVTLPSELSIKGSGTTPTSASAPNGWRSLGNAPGGGKPDAGWGRSSGPGSGRGGGHWRGNSDAPGPGARGGRGGGRGGGDSGRDRDKDADRHDSRVPLPRRNDSPPPRGPGGWGDRDRGGRGGGGRGGNRRSPSRSRSPPRRRSRYD